MKNLFRLLLIIACLSTLSCRKYPDGPTISLRTKKARVVNKWKVDSFYINGTDKTADYRLLVIRETLEFTKSGNFQYDEVSNWSWAVPHYTGTWEFEDKKENLALTPDNTSVAYREFKILKLKNDEMWLQQEVRPDSIIEYHYITQVGS